MSRSAKKPKTYPELLSPNKDNNDSLKKKIPYLSYKMQLYTDRKRNLFSKTPPRITPTKKIIEEQESETVRYKIAKKEQLLKEKILEDKLFNSDKKRPKTPNWSPYKRVKGKKGKDSEDTPEMNPLWTDPSNKYIVLKSIRDTHKNRKYNKSHNKELYQEKQIFKHPKPFDASEHNYVRPEDREHYPFSRKYPPKIFGGGEVTQEDNLIMRFEKGDAHYPNYRVAAKNVLKSPYRRKKRKLNLDP